MTEAALCQSVTRFKRSSYPGCKSINNSNGSDEEVIMLFGVIKGIEKRPTSMLAFLLCNLNCAFKLSLMRLSKLYLRGKQELYEQRF